jgi:hypothetical protein
MTGWNRIEALSSACNSIYMGESRGGIIRLGLFSGKLYL